MKSVPKHGSAAKTGEALKFYVGIFAFRASMSYIYKLTNQKFKKNSFN